MSRRTDPKKESQASQSADEVNEMPSFEVAMQRLEALVAEMEGDDLPLEEMLKRFEEGSSLIRSCRQQLEAAKQSVEVILKKNASEAKLAPFSPQEEE